MAVFGQILAGKPFGITFLPFGDGLQDDNFDPNFCPAPFHVNLKRDGLQDDNFDPNFDPATSHFNLKRDGLQDDNFDPNLTLPLLISI